MVTVGASRRLARLISRIRIDIGTIIQTSRRAATAVGACTGHEKQTDLFSLTTALAIQDGPASLVRYRMDGIYILMVKGKSSNIRPSAFHITGKASLILTIPSISIFRSAPNQVLPRHQRPLNLSHILPRLSPRQPINRESYRQRHHRYDCSTFPIIEPRLLAHLEIVTADEVVVDDPHFEHEGYSEHADEPAPDTG